MGGQTSKFFKGFSQMLVVNNFFGLPAQKWSGKSIPGKTCGKNFQSTGSQHM